MTRYLAARVLAAIPTTLILLGAVFLALRAAPGGPALAILGAQASPERIAEFNRQYHLDEPIVQQFGRYLLDLVQGNFGQSIVSGQQVSELIGLYFPATLELAISGMLFAIVISLLAGLAAARRTGPASTSIHVSSILVYAVPIFWSGLLLQLLFSVRLGWFPVGGRLGGVDPPPHLTGLYLLDSLLAGNLPLAAESLRHLFLPTLTLGLFVGALLTRVVRVAVLGTMRMDYVRTARAKGMAESAVLARHAFRPAIIPVATVAALQFALLLGGAVITETTFAWPGLGRFLVQSVANRDYPAVQGVVAFFTLTVILISLLSDVLNGVLDPRVRY